MTIKIYWKDVAEDIINGNWHETFDGEKSITKYVQDTGNERLTLVLLIDIAKSLRVLRCSNFTAIPSKLDEIRVGVDGLRRDLKKKRRRR